MGDFTSNLFLGQWTILLCFFAAIIFIYIPIWIIILRRRKKRGENFLRQCPDAAIVKIERTKLSGILTVHNVDREKPTLISKGTVWYFYLAPGEHTLSLSYEWQESSIVGKLSSYSNANKIIQGKDAEIQVTVQARSAYVLRYNIESEEYCFAQSTLIWKV
jgi:hypothetical protein